jgi:hypothetical protein
VTDYETRGKNDQNSAAEGFLAFWAISDPFFISDYSSLLIGP